VKKVYNELTSSILKGSRRTPCISTHYLIFSTNVNTQCQWQRIGQSRICY